jgi:GGDEF domain-containing protein
MARENPPESPDQALVLALLPPPGGVGPLAAPAEAPAVTRAASLVIPALLLSMAAVLARAATLPDWLATAVQAGPPVVFGGGALLGLLMGRGRLVLGLVVLALADLAVAHFPSRILLAAAGLLLPLNLALIAWLGEASLFTPRGALRLGPILLQVGVVAVLRRPELAAVATALERPLLATSLDIWTALPQLVLVAFAVALGLALARFLMGGRPLAAGAAWALVASFLALDGATAGRPATVYFVAAGLVLAVAAALESSRPLFRDAVTGLPGRLALYEALGRLPGRYAVARVEIDDFRSFRQDHGVEAARRMLRLVAGALMKVGGGGRAYFWESHAFAVVFPRTSAAEAARHLDVVRRVVERATLDVRVPGRPGGDRPAPAVERTVTTTISVGVAQPDKRGADPHEVLRVAALALERGKQAGLNRVSGLPTGLAASGR